MQLSSAISFSNKIYNKNKCMIKRRTISKPTQMCLRNYQVISHGIVDFTILYCTANWWYYRIINKNISKNASCKDSCNKKKTDKKYDEKN
jgi:hypothetical protein